MGMYHIKTVVGELQCVHIGDHKVDVVLPAFTCAVAGQIKCCGDGLDGGHAARRDEGGQIHRDGSRPAADVEQVQTRCQRTQQIGRGVLRRAGAVGTQHRFMVAVGVFGRCRLSHTGNGTPPKSADDQAGAG
nr:hypothetical protein CPGR_02265 [Mycolicibacter nonchromogenicus]